VPTVAIAGNHDYRLYPWRFRAYGLESVGIPAARIKSVLSQPAFGRRSVHCGRPTLRISWRLKTYTGRPAWLTIFVCWPRLRTFRSHWRGCGWCLPRPVASSQLPQMASRSFGAVAVAAANGSLAWHLPDSEGTCTTSRSPSSPARFQGRNTGRRPFSARAAVSSCWPGNVSLSRSSRRRPRSRKITLGVTA